MIDRYLSVAKLMVNCWRGPFPVSGLLNLSTLDKDQVVLMSNFLLIRCKHILFQEYLQIATSHNLTWRFPPPYADEIQPKILCMYIYYFGMIKYHVVLVHWNGLEQENLQLQAKTHLDKIHRLMGLPSLC